MHSNLLISVFQGGKDVSHQVCFFPILTKDKDDSHAKNKNVLTAYKWEEQR